MTTKTAPSKKSGSDGDRAGDKATFGKETYLRWFKEMLLMRRFEGYSDRTYNYYTDEKTPTEVV